SQVFVDLLHRIHIPPKDTTVDPGRFYVDSFKSARVRMLDYFRWICMLPHIVGRVIYFPMILTRNDLIHQFSCSQHPRQIVISARVTCFSPAFHWTVFIRSEEHTSELQSREN